jgi:hypothetical protein
MGVSTLGEATSQSAARRWSGAAHACCPTAPARSLLGRIRHRARPLGHSTWLGMFGSGLPTVGVRTPLGRRRIQMYLVPENQG